MSDLKLFFNGADTYVARSEEEAARLYFEFVGDNSDDLEWSGVVANGGVLQISYDYIEDACGQVPQCCLWRRRGNYGITFIATIQQWVDFNGEGFLCSLEW